MDSTCLQVQEGERNKVEARLSKWTLNHLNSLMDVLDVPRGSGEEGTKVSQRALLDKSVTQLSITAMVELNQYAGWRRRKKWSACFTSWRSHRPCQTRILPLRYDSWSQGCCWTIASSQLFLLTELLSFRQQRRKQPRPRAKQLLRRTRSQRRQRRHQRPLQKERRPQPHKRRHRLVTSAKHLPRRRSLQR